MAAGSTLLAWALALSVPAFAQDRETRADRSGSIGVRPFANLSGDPADAWIGTGIAEAISADLAAGATDREDPARWLVRGAYQRVGTRLRITAALVDRPTGETVDTVKVDGDVADLFALQDEVGARLAASLGRNGASRPPRPSNASGIVVSNERPAPGDAASGAAIERPPAPPLSTAAAPGAPTRSAGLAVTTAAMIDGPPPPAPPDVASRDARGRVTMRAIRLDEPLTLDARLDERVYQTVAPVTGFVQQEPEEGAPATEQTEVWVMFDGDTIYVAARCWNSEPDRIVANEMKRDSFGMFGNEMFSVTFDTFYDRRNGFSFITNALGGLFDAQITNERNPNQDWNAVWDVRSARFDQGWTVEFAIPFRSLRYRPGPAQIWGVNFQRSVAWKNETSFLTPIPAALGMSGSFKLSSAATLVGLEVPASGPRLEVKPYAISDLTTDLNETPPVSEAFGGDIGIDAKIGVTQGLTADLTYNTDFAQVEVDEQQVNLTRFSLFFPEKREFFLEGQGIFDFGGGQLFNSNSFFTGGGFGDDAPILFFSRRIGLNEGRTVPIRGGGRLTGKAGPFSIGVLDVRTGDESVSGAVPTNFSVVRVKRDVLRRSAIGGMFTGRSVSTEGDGANYAYGVDGVFSFYDNLNINTYYARTRTPGLSGDDVSYRGQFDYNGDRYGVILDRLAVGANFNPEVGFARRDDFRRNYASFRFSPRPESIAAIRKFSWEGSLDYITDGAGLVETRLQQGQFGIEFESGDRFFAIVTGNYEFLKEPFEITDDITIPVGGYSFVTSRLVYFLAQQRTVSGGFFVEQGDFFGGTKTSVGYFQGRVGVTPQLAVEPIISLNWVDLPEGSFSTELVATRATYTITPRMFVAALLQFNSGNDALSTNIRLRWEYQPGSELFVVYTDERDTRVPGFPTLENRALVVKVNRLFRF